MGTIKRVIDFFYEKLFAFYIVFAGIATVVDFAVLAGLVELASLNYLYASAISYLCGMITNFTLNKFLNFKNKSKEVFTQFLLFIIVALIGLGLNQLILYVSVDLIGIHYLVAKIISVGIVMFWSFFGHKKLTFALLQ